MHHAVDTSLLRAECSHRRLGLRTMDIMSQPESISPMTLTVEARAHGWRVDHFLVRHFPNFSRSVFQKAISEGHVQVNGLVVKASRRLRVNDRVWLELPKEPDSRLKPEPIPIEILYEDDAMAVINKQADLITHPGKANYTGTLAAAVQYHFDQLSDMAGQMRPGIVHRLDRDTTGVIVIAKNNAIHHRLSGQFERREVVKEYRAITYRSIVPNNGTIDTHLRVNPKNRKKMIVCEPGERARRAVTKFHVLERFEGFTYMQLFPKTGRTHQLRVHLQHLKHPIIADRAYAGRGELKLSDITGDKSSLGSPRIVQDVARQVGVSNGESLDVEGGKLVDRDDAETIAAAEQTKESPESTLIARQALHAYELSLRHPVTDQPMVFTAPLPDDMQRTLDALYSRIRSES